MEMKYFSEFRHIPGLGDRYRVYPGGTIYRKGYEKILPSGKVRVYKKKKLTQRFRPLKSGGVSNMSEVTISDGKKSKQLLVAQVVLFAWKYSFKKDLWNYPEIVFRDDDQSNHHLSNIRYHDPSEWLDELPERNAKTFRLSFEDGSSFFYYELYDEDGKCDRLVWELKHKAHTGEFVRALCLKEEKQGSPINIELLTENDPRSNEELMEWKHSENLKLGHQFYGSVEVLEDGHLRLYE